MVNEESYSGILMIEAGLQKSRTFEIKIGKNGHNTGALRKREGKKDKRAGSCVCTCSSPISA